MYEIYLFSILIDFLAATNMKLNKGQKTFLAFLYFTLFLIAIILSTLIAKKMFFTVDNEIVYNILPTVTTLEVEPYKTKNYTGPTSSGRRIEKIIKQ